MITAVRKADLYTTCLYFTPFIVHHLLNIENNDLKLNILFLQHNHQHLVRFICHVNVNRKVGRVWRLPEINLQDHEIRTSYSMD